LRSSGLVTSWYWELGDGTTSTEPNPIHTYERVDTYQVRLTVGNGAGTSSISQLIKEREVRRARRHH
jgi:PKD repeat protein